MDNYKYIEPSGDEIKQICKTVKDQLIIISENSSTFTFGWKCNKCILLCQYSSLNPEYLTISLNNSGKLFMDLVEKRAREMGVKGIELKVLPNDKLIKWYKSIGYVHINTIFSKVYNMIKILN
jgi:hypothetical protein